MNRAILACILILPLSVVVANEADDAYKMGVESLRQSQTDHAALVPAIKLLAKASELYESQVSAKVTEVNSCLYWAKKKMTLADTEALGSSAEVASKLNVIAKPVAISEAQAWLDKANAYSKVQPDPLLVAVRYFEVGDRFKDSDAGRAAIELSLKAMQHIGEKSKLSEYKPLPTDGKVFVQSDPSGASIILFVSAVRQDSGKKTPALIQIPKGVQTLSLELAGMKPASFSVEVGDAIVKPPAIKLDQITFPVDIVFQEGWTIFVDGKSENAINGERAVSPCTIAMAVGSHTVAVAKAGFWDIAKKVKIADHAVVEFTQSPAKGKSTLLTAETAKPTNWLVVFRSVDGTLWGKDVNTANDYSIDHARIPAEIKYLKLTRVDNGDFVIIPITKGSLKKASDAERYGWWGSANMLGGDGPHLGICDTKMPVRKNGDLIISTSYNQNYSGWGFGHNPGFSSHSFVWRGKEIPKTAFEISVTNNELSEAEQKALLK